MARVTATEVKAIMDNCTLADGIVDNYITPANALVTEILGDDTDMTDTLLEEIEKNLAAHFIAMTLHRTTQEEEVGDARVKFTGYWGKKLESTPYGHIVLVLDFTGKMLKAGKGGAMIKAIESFDD